MEWKAVIFDMDGLLVNSEPLWRQAEQEVFSQLGIALNDELCRQTTGLGTEETVHYWLQRTLWTKHDQEVDVPQVAKQLRERVKALLQEYAEPMPGAMAILQRCQQLGMKAVIASGSSMALIETVIDKLGLDGYIGAYFSAANEAAGKPAPDVYLRALSSLRLPAQCCAAFEDSLRGAQAAKAAGLFTYAVPEEGSSLAEFESTADVVVKDLSAVLTMAPFYRDHVASNMA